MTTQEALILMTHHQEQLQATAAEMEVLSARMRDLVLIARDHKRKFDAACEQLTASSQENDAPLP